MADKSEYYNKILDAWIAKMKDNGFKFGTRKPIQNDGIELIYFLSDNNPFNCLIVDYDNPNFNINNLYDNPNFNINNLYDRLHKLELLIPRLNEAYNNIKKEGNVSIFSHYHIINLSYLLYTYSEGPYLIETYVKSSKVKNYFTYIDDNGQFKTTKTLN